MQTTKRVAEVIESEEKAFFATIDGGMKRIEQLFEQMREESAVMVPGGVAAELNTTYGVPPELLQTLSAEQNFTFDWAGYRSGDGRTRRLPAVPANVELFQTGPLETLKEALRETPFVGYDTLEATAIIKGIITGSGEEPGDDGQLLSHVDRPGDNEMRIVLSESPFYGESGGQIGDTGVITQRELRVRRHRYSKARRPDRSSRQADNAANCTKVNQCTAKVDMRTARRWPAPIRRRTSCTTRCTRTSAITLNNKAARSNPIDCDLTLPIKKRFRTTILVQIEQDVWAQIDDAIRSRLANGPVDRSTTSRGDDAVRRKVSRSSTDGFDGRFQQRTLRRDARQQHQADSSFRVGRRGKCLCRYAPHRGIDGIPGRVAPPGNSRGVVGCRPGLGLPRRGCPVGD